MLRIDCGEAEYYDSGINAGDKWQEVMRLEYEINFFQM